MDSTPLVSPAAAVPVASAAAVPVGTAEPAVWAESVRVAVDARPCEPCTVHVWIAGILQVAFFVFLAIWLQALAAGESWPPEGADPNGLQTGGMGSIIVAVMMMVEVCVCPSAAFLRHILPDGSAYQHVEDVRKAAPSVHWHIQCYHYETVHYTETRTDEDGNEHVEHKTREERRNTHSASANYHPYYWEDISSPFPDIGTASLTRLTFDKSMVFADAQSAEHFRAEKMSFLAINQRDTHYDFSEDFRVPGFESHVLACKNEAAVPGWLNQGAFYLASLFCLTIPFRFAFSKLCWEVPKYGYIKRFYSHPIAPVYCPV